MRASLRRGVLVLSAIFFLFTLQQLPAQTGNSGTIAGTVTDSTGAVVPGATVTITDPVSGYTRTATSDASGNYQFTNVPFNPYHLTVEAKSFASFVEDVDVRSGVPVKVTSALKVGESSTTVTVESGGDLVENDPTFHTDVDRSLFQKLPLESQSSSLSSLVTLASPGVAADSNGLFHGLGDHASNSFSIDGQSITDQQSKVFSNQIPTNAVQSLEVISGAPPAEYGGKTSLVIVATTRSGQGITTPTGSVYASYGSFGSASGGFDLSYGGKNWGNFLEFDGLNTGRFLDPPEFTVFHDKGNEENIFDRVDYSFTPVDSVHLDLNYSRSWFQTPNSFDNLNVQNVISGGRFHGSGLRYCGQHRPALLYRDIRHPSNVHPGYRQRLGLQLGRLGPKGPVRLLSQRKSSGRSRTAQPADLLHHPAPFPAEYRSPRRLFVCQGNQQFQSWRPIWTNIPARERRLRRRRERLQFALHGCQWQPPDGLQRPWAVRGVWIPGQRQLPSCPRTLRSHPRWDSVQLCRPHGCEGVGPLSRRPD